MLNSKRNAIVSFLVDAYLLEFFLSAFLSMLHPQESITITVVVLFVLLLFYYYFKLHKKVHFRTIGEIIIGKHYAGKEVYYRNIFNKTRVYFFIAVIIGMASLPRNNFTDNTQIIYSLLLWFMCVVGVIMLSQGLNKGIILFVLPDLISLIINDKDFYNIIFSITDICLKIGILFIYSKTFLSKSDRNKAVLK